MRITLSFMLYVFVIQALNRNNYYPGSVDCNKSLQMVNVADTVTTPYDNLKATHLSVCVNIY